MTVDPASSPPGAPTLAERIVTLIQRARWPLVLGLLLVSVAAVLAATRVGVDNSVEIWFVDDDPALAAYRDFQGDFGNDEVVALAVRDPLGMLDARGMERLRAVEAAARSVEGIARVRSLASVESIRAGEDWLEVGPLAPDPLPPDFRERVLADPLVRGRLISEDERTALVLAWMASMDDMDARRDAILADLRARVAEVEEDTAYAGIGVIYAALNRASTVDSAGLLGGSTLVIVALLALLYRRPGPVLLTLGVVGVAALWLMGIFGALGHHINMVTMVLPTLVIIIGVSACIHFLNRLGELPQDLDPATRARQAVAFMLWPCLINAATTAAGFASLLVAPMPVIRDLGTFAALGVLGAFAVALAASALVLGNPWFHPSPRPLPLLDGTVEAASRLVARRPGWILVGALVALLVGALGMTRLEVDTYSIDYLKASHPVRQDSDAIERDFGPYTPLEFTVSAPGALRDPAVLGAVARWQDAVEAAGLAGWSQSVADVARRLEQVLTDGSAGAYRVPEDPIRLEQALLLYESDPDHDLESLVAGDGDRLRVTMGIPMASARGIGERLDRILAALELPPGATVTAGGYLPLYVQIMRSVVVSQVSSFLVAFLVIFLVLAILFRSPRLALVAMPANLVPIVLILGFMGATGIRLDVATVTISAVLLGLAVDDTTQLVYRFRYELDRLGDHAAAAQAALRGAGRAMAATTLVLALGFSVVAFASIKSVAWFGVLMAVALVAALAADLLLLPAMLVRFKPRV